MTILARDVRYSLRAIRRSPLFASVAILSLALGIGANTAIFTLIDQILLRKLPVRDPEQLVMLYQQGAHNGSNMGRGCTPIRSIRITSRRRAPLSEVLCRRLDRSLDQHRQPDRAGRRRDGLGQLLHDARREARARTRVHLRGRRPRCQGPSGRRAELRLLGQPLRARPERDRQEDPGEQLPDDDRRRVGRRVSRVSIRRSRRRSACRS